MPFTPHVVLTGDVKLGIAANPSTSYKAEISSIEVTEMRSTVVVPATLDTGAEGKKAGVYSAEVTINVLGDLQATSLYTLMRDAVRNGTPLFMEALLKPGAVGSGNPEYQAQLAVTQAKIGTAVGGLSQFSVTLPVDGLVSTVIV